MGGLWVALVVNRPVQLAIATAVNTLDEECTGKKVSEMIAEINCTEKHSSLCFSLGWNCYSIFYLVVQYPGFLSSQII